MNTTHENYSVFCGYLDCMEWLINEEEEAKRVELDVDLVWSDEAFEIMTRDVNAYITRVESEIPDVYDYWDEAQLGHDFYLDRCRHGAGARDRYSQGRGEEIGDQLTSIAKEFSEHSDVDPYIEDDAPHEFYLM